MAEYSAQEIIETHQRLIDTRQRIVAGELGWGALALSLIHI